MPNFDYAENLLRNVMPNEDWDTSAHLKKTPDRFAKMLRDLTRPDSFEFTTFPAEGLDEMVTVLNIPFYTFCAHHVLPFFGKCHIAYVPDREMAGISKLPRTVQHFSRGLNVQEELTVIIANFIDSNLSPQGVAVIMEAEHLCMTMRGAQVPGTRTKTSAMLGCFADHTKLARSEFLAMVNHG